MPDPKIEYARKVWRDLNKPLSESKFDKFMKDRPVAKKVSAIEGVRKGGVSATNLAAGLKGKKAEAAKKSGTSVKQVKAGLKGKAKAKRKAVRTAASVGRPSKFQQKVIGKAKKKTIRKIKRL